MPDARRTLPRRRFLALCLALCSSIAPGCERLTGDATGAQAADSVAVTPSDAPATAPSEPLPERIYFDLTEYEWYAHGEPLMHADVAYRMGSGVVAAPTSSMRKVGEYEGVDVYTPDGVTQDTAVYVPVYPGYWLAFHRADSAASAAEGN